MDTWGISGPRFLLIYVVLLGVATLLAVVGRRRALAGPVQGAVVPSRLDPYEAAYLNGGEALVATTAVSSLFRGGQLANAGRRRGRVRLVTGAAPPAGVHPVEWAAYELVAAQPNRSLGDLRAALGQSPAVAAVRERLRRAGLAPTPEQQARYRAAGLWFLPPLALGWPGWSPGRPTGGRSGSWSRCCSSPP